MTCPIKTPDGEIDDEALSDLTQIGGYIVEGGIKTFPEWAKAMQAKVGNVFNNGDLQTIWANVKADARQRTGVTQTTTKADVFVEKMARRLGSNRAAADFANALVGPDGDTTLINKIVDGKSLTPQESAIVAQAFKENVSGRKPGGKATAGPMGIVQKALDDARASGRMSQRRQTKPAIDPVTRSLKAGLRGNVDKFMADMEAIHPGAIERLKAGAATPEEMTAIGEAYVKHAPDRTPASLTQGQQMLKEAAKEARYQESSTYKDEPAEGYKVQPDKELEPKEPPTDDVLFDRHMARTLGSADAAEHFKNALGDDLYTKLVGEGSKALTPQETDAVTRAFAESAKPRSASNPSELSRALAPIAREARAQIALHEAEAKTETFEKAKGWVREQLADVLPARKLPSLDKALDALADGNHTGLSHVFNQFAPRGFVKTGRLYTQGAMLSNPASLATAVYSHLLSAGVEQTAAKFIASKLSGGLHASIDPQMLSAAIAKSVKQGAPEAWQVLKHGENALTLQGANALHKPGAPLSPEFTVGQGGQIGNAVSAVGRFPGRMHGAAWHAIGVGMQELVKQDAAHYAAIDEMEKRGEQWSPEEVRARARELYDNPTEAVLSNAQKLREEQMFQNPNAAAEMVKKAGPLATPVLPFATVASNITGRALEHTPIGAAVSAGNQIAKFAKANNLPLENLADFKAALKAMPAVDRAHLYKVAARGVVGTGIIAAAYAGQRAGIVNAPNPKRGEYGSVNAFGRKIEAGRALGPYAAPLFLGADAAQNQENEEAVLPTGPQVAGAFGENPFSNVSEVYQNLTDTSKVGSGKPTGTMKAAASIVGAEIPSFLRAVAASTDPSHSLRNANTDEFAKYIWNSMKKAVPGARETLPPLPYPEPSTLLPVPRNVPDQNGNFGLNFLKEWAAARAQH